MSHQFKPGDLALTLKDATDMPAMSQVELVCMLNPEKDYRAINGQKVRFEGEFWKVRYGERKFAFHRNLLMPLRGDFAPEQTKSREVPA